MFIEVALNRLEALLDVAVRTSSTATDPYKDEIEADFSWITIDKACKCFAENKEYNNVQK